MHLLLFPAIGVIAALALVHIVRRRRDCTPFYIIGLIFAAAFGTLFWGEALFVFPLMLVYAAVNHSVFRGKVQPTSEHY
ncbi:MAG: hypothetical protein JOY71_07475 [Acetobacteraceae bacterium]|nr:hypothetical protein [Acetobacteraceae bacterium]